MSTEPGPWRCLFVAILVCCASSAPLRAAARGIEIQPDDEGAFAYVDDFQTPRFLRETFVTDYRPDCWSPGALQNHGPLSWSLVYRFHGSRAITGIQVEVEQWANGPNLGGQNRLFVSRNGLDWNPAMGSGDLTADHNGTQAGTLTINEELGARLQGGTEIWLRLELRNYSGLPTGTSNGINQLKVELTTGDPAAAGPDPQRQAHLVWGTLRAGSGWRDISLDVADPQEHRAPHYYEDIDGWLRAPGDSRHLVPDASRAFPIQSAGGTHERKPLSLVAFVRADGPGDSFMMARITTRATRNSSRQLAVAWNGRTVDTFDAASFFDEDRTFYVPLDGRQQADPQELRLSSADGRPVSVRRITVAGEGRLGWAAKPALPEGGRLAVLSAHYMPDPAPPPASQAVEGRHDKQEIGLNLRHLQKMYTDHADFGALRIVLHNDGAVPVRIGDRITLNGRPIADHHVDFRTSAWDARGVVWHRIRPQLVEPGGCAQVYIRFRRRPAGDAAAVTIPLVNGESAVAINVPYRAPGLSIDYVTTDAGGKQLYVYARRSEDADVGSVTGMTLDGVPVAGTRVHGADFPGNVALLVGEPATPLETGDHHVVAVQTESGPPIAAQFRVLRFFYPRSSIHVPSEMCREMNMNLAMWYARSLAECEKHDIYTTNGSHTEAHERVLYVLGPDEPDAHDNRGGGYDKGLGAVARSLADTGWQELIERYAPQAASWIIMNGTTRPLNWCVYGQMADIACFDPYPVTYYAADHAYVRESLALARRCGAPNRMFGCMEAFGWGKGQGVPGGARGPSPAEYRQNIVQAIGCGMKGLTSWVYVSGAGGWELDEPCRREIAKLNKLIEHIEGELLLATPIDLASTDAGAVMTGVASSDGTRTEVWPKQRVWAGALLSGPDTIIVAAANHIPASKPEPPTIEPARDVTISVELPAYLQRVRAFEVTEDGIAPIDMVIEGNQARLRLEAIESGRVFLLRRAS